MFIKPVDKIAKPMHPVSSSLLEVGHVLCVCPPSKMARVHAGRVVTGVAEEVPRLRGPHFSGVQNKHHVPRAGAPVVFRKSDIRRPRKRPLETFVGERLRHPFSDPSERRSVPRLLGKVRISVSVEPPLVLAAHHRSSGIDRRRTVADLAGSSHTVTLPCADRQRNPYSVLRQRGTISPMREGGRDGQHQ